MFSFKDVFSIANIDAQTEERDFFKNSPLLRAEMALSQGRP